MCWTQKFSFSTDPVILDLKLQLAQKTCKFSLSLFYLCQLNKIQLMFDQSCLVLLLLELLVYNLLIDWKWSCHLKIHPPQKTSTKSLGRLFRTTLFFSLAWDQCPNRKSFFARIIPISILFVQMIIRIVIL
jgi:hypothetical protein